MFFRRKKASIRDYELLSIIGRGAFGEVRIVRHKDTKEVFAMKKMKKQEMDFDFQNFRNCVIAAQSGKPLTSKEIRMQIKNSNPDAETKKVLKEYEAMLKKQEE